MRLGFQLGLLYAVANLQDKLLGTFLLLLLSSDMRLPEGRTARCRDMRNIERTVRFSDAYDLMKKCPMATAIALKKFEVLVVKGEQSMSFSNWMARYKNLSMCLSIENSSSFIMRFNSIVKGRCKGPDLSIVNNDYLVDLQISRETLKEMIAANSFLRIRGNPKLKQATLNLLKKKNPRWDIQHFGECSLPSPFTTFRPLLGCTFVYGILKVDPALESVDEVLPTKQKFHYTGCIQLENTKLKNVSFLKAFSKFEKVQECNQYVRGNAKLCPEDISFLTTMFPGLELKNNGKSCDYCVGGLVSEVYLRRISNCTTIRGDVIITNLTVSPPNVKLLNGIRTITGKLIITNNTDLHDFNYFSSLERVGSKNDTGGVVIIVKNNPDLSSLLIPKLKNISIEEGDHRVELANNPKLLRTTTILFRTTSTVSLQPTRMSIFITTSKQDEHFAHTSGKGSSRIELGLPDRRKGSQETSNTGSLLLVIIGVVAILVLAIAIAVAKFVVYKKNRKLGLPPPPYDLSKKSAELLRSMSKDISCNSPMLWYADHNRMLCSEGRSYGGADEDVASDYYVAFVEKNMLPLAMNARIPLKKVIQKNTPLQIRVREFLNYDWVVAIGSENDITTVVPHLPQRINDSFIYVDVNNSAECPITYKLLEVNVLSSTTVHYKYSAGGDTKKKIIDVLFHYWENERLPIEFTELLRILVHCGNSKVICTSTRRKESFSLMHLLFKSILLAKRPIPIAAAIRLHSGLCNGAPLERSEMLYIMRVILEWARRSNCISPNYKQLLRKWCTSYDEMAAFFRDNPNIVTIHPRHLKRNASTTRLQHVLDANRNKIIDFSERPHCPMKDRFRKFVREEKEWKKLNPQDAETSKQSASKPVGSLQDLFWGPIKENPKATNSECTAKSYETSKVSQYGTSKDQQSKSEEIEKGKDNRNQNTT